jgi:hypothetical protein
MDNAGAVANLLLIGSVFLLFGIFYLGYRIKKNLFLIKERRNRYFIYGILLVLPAAVLGEVGVQLRNNYVLYLASTSIQVAIYCYLVAAGISYKQDAQKIHRPVALTSLIAVNLFDLVCFQLAGAEAQKYIRHIDSEVIKSSWLLTGRLAITLYMVVIIIIAGKEMFGESEKSDRLATKYLAFSNVWVSVLIFGYYGIDLFRFGLHLIGINVLLPGFFLKQTLAAAIFLTIVIRVLADKLIFKAVEWISNHLALRRAMKLKKLYELLNAKFPAVYRFDPYPIYDDGFEDEAWLLTELTTSFNDLRFYFLQAEYLRNKKVGNLKFSDELKIWQKCIEEPELTTRLFTGERPDRTNKIGDNGKSKTIRFYLKINRGLELAAKKQKKPAEAKLSWLKER